MTEETLIESNKAAMRLLAMTVTPIGISVVIIAAGLIEMAGITLYFSQLFLSKAYSYLTVANLKDPLWRYFAIAISFGGGFLLACIATASVFVLKLLRKDLWALLFSVAFAALAFSTYASLFAAQTGAKRILGMFSVGLIVFFSAAVVNVLSTHLAKATQEIPLFKRILEEVYNGARGTFGNQIFMNRKAS